MYIARPTPGESRSGWRDYGNACRVRNAYSGSEWLARSACTIPSRHLGVRRQCFDELQKNEPVPEVRFQVLHSQPRVRETLIDPGSECLLAYAGSRPSTATSHDYQLLQQREREMNDACTDCRAACRAHYNTFPVMTASQRALLLQTKHAPKNELSYRPRSHYNTSFACRDLACRDSQQLKRRTSAMNVAIVRALFILYIARASVILRSEI